jgi:hypothetical protein
MVGDAAAAGVDLSFLRRCRLAPSPVRGLFLCSISLSLPTRRAPLRPSDQYIAPTQIHFPLRLWTILAAPRARERTAGWGLSSLPIPSFAFSLPHPRELATANGGLNESTRPCHFPRLARPCAHLTSIPRPRKSTSPPRLWTNFPAPRTRERKAKNIAKTRLPQKDNVVNLPLKSSPKMGIVSRLI